MIYLPTSTDNKDCCICLEPLVENVVAHTNPKIEKYTKEPFIFLIHEIHEKCLKAHFYSSVTNFDRCPECRCKVNLVNIIPGFKENAQTHQGNVQTHPEGVQTYRVPSVLYRDIILITTTIGLLGLSWYLSSKLCVPLEREYSYSLNSAMFVPLGVISEIFLHNMTCSGRNTEAIFNNSLGRYFFIAVMIKLPPFITQRSKLDLALIGVTIGSLFTRYITRKYPQIHEGVHNIKPNITFALQRVWRYIKSFFNYDLTVARVQ